MWEFIPNMELNCLQFVELQEMYPVDCENALATGFLKVEGSPCDNEDHTAENATNKAKRSYSGPMVGGGAK